MDIEIIKKIIKNVDENRELINRYYNGKYKILLLNANKIINDIIKENYINVLKP